MRPSRPLVIRHLITGCRGKAFATTVMNPGDRQRAQDMRLGNYDIEYFPKAEAPESEDSHVTK